MKGVDSVSTKKLSELVNQVLDKERKMKIEIHSLENENAELTASIKVQTNRLVECQMAGDGAGKEKHSKEIRKFRLRASEIEDILDAYRSRLEHGLLSDQEAQKVRDAAVKVSEARGKKLVEVRTKNDEIRDQIHRLEKQLEHGEAEYHRFHNTRVEETELSKIIGAIDSRAVKLDHITKVSFLRNWIVGNDTTKFF